MKVEVNYTKEVNCCKECPYYFQEHDMGATIPMCIKNKEIMILSNPNIIPNDCPIDAIKVKPFDTSSVGKENKCNCATEYIKTYQDILIEFNTKFPMAEIDDYRPACGMYIDGLDDCTNIPNAIVVWLKDGSKIIYIAER